MFADAIEDPKPSSHARKVVVSRAKAPNFIAGRRSFVKYRDLGVADATGNDLRAQVIIAGSGDNKPTGWHAHICDVQFLYVLSGSLTIVLGHEEEDTVELEAGDSIMIPGGAVHQEWGNPQGVQVLEVSIPADMGTEERPAPSRGPAGSIR